MEERNFSKVEEDQEMKSLRRIISAYINYADAAEEDVGRYESSFRKLPSAHKALLSHLSLKYQRLRRCISMNSFFIMNMIQAFEPPLNMGQDIDIEERENVENVTCGHLQTELCQNPAVNSCPGQLVSNSGTDVFAIEPSSFRLGTDGLCEPPRKCSKAVYQQEMHKESCSKSNLDKPMMPDYHRESCNSNGNTDKLIADPVSGCCDSTSNVNVRSPLHDLMDPALKLNVPLVDVDKVRCIVRNIVRDWAPEGQKERDQCYKPILEELKRVFPVRCKESVVDTCGYPFRRVKMDGYSQEKEITLGVFSVAETNNTSCTFRRGRMDSYSLQEKEIYSLQVSRDFILSRCPVIWWPPCCLVPGAGLGRLALEISCLGFETQGNEFSYYMMICSSFILNHTQIAGEWTIYPWIHSNSNSLSDDDQLRPVSFPDIIPASAGITEGFSMCGGDFVEVYSDVNQEGAWDVVVTCFFLDTAHNIVEYIEIISKILKEGGVWINFGPLLYHFADSYGPDDDMSIEISLEDLKKIAFHYGFELEMEKTIETTYTANPQSMMQNRYFAAFWTMKKTPKS